MRAMPAPQKDGPRANRDIRGVREVQLIDDTGQNRGVVPFPDALQMAEEAGLDLVEIAPNSTPPVCKILDYGKFRFHEQKKAAEARKKQKTVEVKEIKLRPGIDDHDYDVKMRAMKALLRGRRQSEGHAALPRSRDGATNLGLQGAGPGQVGDRRHRQGRDGAQFRGPPGHYGAGPRDGSRVSLPPAAEFGGLPERQALLGRPARAVFFHLGLSA